MWRISEEGNTGTRQKKKTTALRLLLFCVDSISEEFAGFSPLWFPREKLLVSLVSCDVLMLYCCTWYSLSKDPNIMLA